MFTAIHRATTASLTVKQRGSGDLDKIFSRNKKIAFVADVVTGVALVTIGLLAFKGMHIGLTPSAGLLMATAGGGSLTYLAMRLAEGKGEKLFKSKQAESGKRVPVGRKIVMSLFRVAAVSAVALGALGMTGFLPFSPQLSFALIGAGGGYLLSDSLVVSGNLINTKLWNRKALVHSQKRPYSNSLWA